jgi:hypothetical protein
MRSLKQVMIDRLVLVVAATLLLSAIVALVAFTQSTGLDDVWGMFLFQTIVWPPIIVVQATRLFRSRHRRLYRRWPLVAVGIGAFVLHCTILGLVIYRFHPDWRMPHWAIIDLVELAVIGVLLEFAHEYSILPTASTLSEFLAHLKRSTSRRS